MGNHRKTNQSMGTCPTLLFYLFFVLLSNTVFALPEDNQAILEMRADSVDINQNTHHGLYTGNIELDQGTTHIRATQATTESNKKNQLVLATIIGDENRQAHYWVLIAHDKPLLHAYADTIQYYPEQHKIVLIGHARIKQGNNSFSASTITYDMLHQHVISKPNPHERTVIVYHPEPGHKSIEDSLQPNLGALP